jgi:hypothetical protein
MYLATFHNSFQIKSAYENIQNAAPIRYALSKQLAEKAATDFVQQMPEAEKFQLCIILPTLILGDVRIFLPIT